MFLYNVYNCIYIYIYIYIYIIIYIMYVRIVCVCLSQIVTSFFEIFPNYRLCLFLVVFCCSKRLPYP